MFLSRCQTFTLLRISLLIPLLCFLLACIGISVVNPGFVDTFPLFSLVSCFVVSVIIAIASILLISLISLFKMEKKSPSVIEKLGSERVFILSIISSVILYLALFMFALGYRSNNFEVNPPKLLVLGLDGATWNLMDPLMEKERMPYLKELCDRSSKGILTSLDPMLSPVLWASISTGREPDEHGVEGFFSTKSDLNSPRVWDLCALKSLQVGLFSWLLSWPPSHRFAFDIPSWMAHGPEAFPPEYACVQEVILEQGRYGGEYKPFFSLFQCALHGAGLGSIEQMLWFYLRDEWGFSEEARFAAKLTSEVRLQTDMFLALMRQEAPDVAAFTLYGTDKLGHRFWHYMEPEAFEEVENRRYRFSDVINDYYEEADEAFGRILSKLPESTYVMILSDHGMKADTALPRQFFIDIPELMEVLDTYGYFNTFFMSRRMVLEPFADTSEETINYITEQIESIVFKESGDNVFRVQKQSDGSLHVRTNFPLSWHPESPVLEQEEMVINEKTYPTSRFFFARTFSGNHHPEGILILAGPDVKKGYEIEGADLLDIAPTSLAILDLPLSRELSGSILQQAFEEEKKVNYVEKYEPVDFSNQDDTQLMEQYLERLRSVGYIE